MKNSRINNIIRKNNANHGIWYNSKSFKGVLLYCLSLILMITSINMVSPVRAEASSPAEYSAVFDAVYYSSHYSDLMINFGTDENLLFQHFLSYGMKEGRQASEEFNVKAYRDRYADLQKAFGDDLKAYYLHYIRCGKAEGRNGRKDGAEPAKEHVFYDNAIFIGDTVLNDLHSYAQLNESSVIAGSDFLTMDTFSLKHALKPLEDDTTKPSLKGIKYDTWEAIRVSGSDRVFLQFGINDLRNDSPSAVYNKYLELISKIQKNCPGVKIYVISMMPVAEGATKGKVNKNTIVLLNDKLRKGAVDNGYVFLNMYESLTDDKGNLKEDYCSDGYMGETQKAFKEKWEKVFLRFAKEQMALEGISG